jgi:hypothetical protein
VKSPSFEDLAKVIHDSARLEKDKRIDPDTQVWRDLGISGTDGARLLKAIENHYQMRFTSEIYDRIKSSPRESREESPVIQSLLGGSISEELPITIGQLYRVILQELHGK